MIIQMNLNSFNYTQLTFGKYITSIGGIKEDEANQIYWILYKLKDEPKSDNPPTSDMAVDFG
jgi:hypothetical protein